MSEKRPEGVIRCVVASIDKGGAPHLFPVRVECSEKGIEEGIHYDMAEDATSSESLSPSIVFDEDDDRAFVDWVFQNRSGQVVDA